MVYTVERDTTGGEWGPKDYFLMLSLSPFFGENTDNGRKIVDALSIVEMNASEKKLHVTYPAGQTEIGLNEPAVAGEASLLAGMASRWEGLVAETNL